jgi:hypothetical protein
MSKYETVCVSSTVNPKTPLWNLCLFKSSLTDPQASDDLRRLIGVALALFGRPGVRDELVTRDSTLAQEVVLLGDLLLRLLQDESA